MLVYAAMSNKLIIFKKESPKIKTIEKFQPEVIIFNSKEDFAEYIDKEKDNLKDLSTCKLNKMFSIPGYHITRIKGEIALKKSKDNTKETTTNAATEDRLKERELVRSSLDCLRDDIQTIRDTLNSLIRQLYEKGVIEVT